MTYLAIYILVGVLFYGVQFAFWQKKYSDCFSVRADRIQCLCASVVWPITLPAWIVFAGRESFKYGLKF